MDFDELDDDERQLMDEINFVQDSGPRVVRKPPPSRAFRRDRASVSQEDEDIDEGSYPVKGLYRFAGIIESVYNEY